MLAFPCAGQSRHQFRTLSAQDRAHAVEEMEMERKRAPTRRIKPQAADVDTADPAYIERLRRSMRGAISFARRRQALKASPVVVDVTLDELMEILRRPELPVRNQPAAVLVREHCRLWPDHSLARSHTGQQRLHTRQYSSRPTRCERAARQRHERGHVAHRPSSNEERAEGDTG